MKNFFYSLTLYEKGKFFVFLIAATFFFNLSFFLLTRGLGVHWVTIFMFSLGLIVLSWAVSPKVPLIDIFNNDDVEESKLSDRLSSFGETFLVFSLLLYFIEQLLIWNDR